MGPLPVPSVWPMTYITSLISLAASTGLAGSTLAMLVGAALGLDMAATMCVLTFLPQVLQATRGFDPAAAGALSSVVTFGNLTGSILALMIYTRIGRFKPVALHLDHGTYEDCLKCIDAGFTSVMYDGSHEETFEINLEKTAKIVEIAHAKGISVEAEVGGIGGVEDGVTSKGELADPQQCKAIADTGIDFLACGIGNIHGLYPEDWEGLSFDRLQEIKAKTGDLPLVLHGGTGIPVDQVKKAISLGISKINVNTDLQLVFAAATRKYIEEGLDQQGKGYDPRKLLKPGREAIKVRTEELIKEFGSDGKGWN